MERHHWFFQYLHDHARLICDRKNEEDGPGTWRITLIQMINVEILYSIADPMENFQE